MRLIPAVLVLVLALLTGGGCADARDRVTDGDRQVVHQGMQSAAIVRQNFEVMHAALVQAPPDVPLALAVLAKSVPPMDDTVLGLRQLNMNFGDPTKPEPYSGKKSADSRKQSEQEHASAGWLGILQKIGIGIATALTIATTALNLPVVGPWLASTGVGQFLARVTAGKAQEVAQDAVKTISVIRSESEKAPLGPADVVRLATRTFSPSTAAIADKVSDRIEEKFGISVTPVRELPAGTPS